MNWLLLASIPLIILGFAVRLNPFLVVTFVGIYAGIVAKFDFVKIVSDIGQSFVNNRYVAIIWLILPLLAVLERKGLKEQAKNLISKIKTASTGKILIAYFIFRQVTAALGLLSLGGHAQMIRPLIAPMAEAAAKLKFKNLTHKDNQKIKAHSAATDNVAVFFGEDIFIAVHSILFIKAFYETSGIIVEPIHLSLWAIPSGILALIIHCSRLYLLDRKLEKTYRGK
ncbi:DUF969 domain-containing protein [Campylobacter aviculae]|uniref:DUF969 domain-containing protein n=1 Tax=Campylobacter aviculae TaxID=2510190 RepID=A0A4U7BUN2_9BACT|nr:DUF969 domain-containing protein [Campylobacter aviculae]TKX32754.1 DUF969 domain-containing protein [Campylobacter aviculae]